MNFEITISPKISRGQTALNMALLYMGKFGAVVVGLLILPQFNRLMGVAQFGVAAVLLSIQSLLLVLDLGMSTLVARDVAAQQVGHQERAVSWHTSEAVLTAFFLLLVPVAYVVNIIAKQPLTLVELAAALCMCWALTMQNVGQVALLAARHIATSSLIQLGGVLLRALITLVALRDVESSLTVFVVTQALGAVLHWQATRFYCQRLFQSKATTDAPLNLLFDRALALAKRGSPLVLVGIAGSAAMQLDKSLVSAFTSSVQTAPYYLATVLCLTPLSTLAGPVSQLHQPRLIRAIEAGDNKAIHTSMSAFTSSLVLITFVPSAILWLMRDAVVYRWLGSTAVATDVINYTSILLPGVAVGALGYLPCAILIAKQDFRFQAVASSCMTVLTLAAAAVFAARQNVEGVCWVYAGYHCTSTLVLWIRCAQLEARATHHAKMAGLRAAALAILACLPALALAIAYPHIV